MKYPAAKTISFFRDWTWTSYNTEEYHPMVDCMSLTHSNRALKTMPVELEFQRNDDATKPLDMRIILVQDFSTFWKTDIVAQGLDEAVVSPGTKASGGIFDKIMSIFG